MNFCALLPPRLHAASRAEPMPTSTDWTRSDKSRWRASSMRHELAPFDASDFLSSDEVIEEYLKAALEDPNPELFLLAVANVAKARGIAKVAKGAGLGRESLYKALAPGAKPRYETVRKLVNSLGMRLTVTATLR
jgi:probable addiction module antidote protein